MEVTYKSPSEPCVYAGFRRYAQLLVAQQKLTQIINKKKYAK